MSSSPKTHQALVQHVYAEPLKLDTIPVPQATPGSAVVKVECAPVISYMKNVYNGVRKYQYPTPLVTGTAAYGRVAALGPDSTALKIGDLVMVDPTIRSRDEPGDIILSGMAQGGTAGSKKLIDGEWRDSSYAQYMKAPLENCFKLDEERLIKQLGYEVEQLSYIGAPLVPYGGLHDIDVQPGETVIIAPATGQFGGGAVAVALAMGARVIALGRNATALASLKKLDSRVETVQMMGDVEKEMAELAKFGRIDAYFDISPIAAQNSTHFKSCILSLRHGGRVSLMGGLLDDLPLPHRFIMRRNITLKGKWMYDRKDVIQLIKMVENGNFKLDFVKPKTFGLDQWEEAFDHAIENTGFGEVTLLKPKH